MLLLPTKFVVPDHLYNTRQHSLLFSYFLNIASFISNYFHSNKYNIYGLYNLLSRLLVLLIVSVESIVIINCSYCAIYADCYCLTQGKELFACG